MFLSTTNKEENVQQTYNIKSYEIFKGFYKQAIVMTGILASYIHDNRVLRLSKAYNMIHMCIEMCVYMCLCVCVVTLYIINYHHVAKINGNHTM